MKCTDHKVEVMKILGLTLLMIVWTDARPATYNEYVALQNDVASVGSLRREVRQPPPLGYASEARDLLVAGNEPKKHHGQKKPIITSGKSDEGAFFKTYGSDADGTKGYVKESFGKGDHGYKNLDTFHKQGGDNYGFEKHTEFGNGKKGHKGGHHGKKASKKEGDPEGSGTIVESHYADEGEGYSGGDGGEYYSEGDGSYEGGSGESESGYGDSEGYSEQYSSGEADGEGESEGYSEGGDEDDGYYEGDY